MMTEMVLKDKLQKKETLSRIYNIPVAQGRRDSETLRGQWDSIEEGIVG